MAKNRFWTVEEVGLLRDLVSKSTPNKEIAVRLGRQTRHIAGKKRDLGLLNPDRHRWTADEIETLRTLVSQSMPNREIAIRIGCDPIQVAMKKLRLGLKKPEGGRTAVVASIVDMIEKGSSRTVVSSTLDVPVYMVDRVVRREAAVGPRSTMKTTARPFDTEMVAMSTEGISESEIARRLGLSRHTVSSRLVTLARRDAIAEMREDQVA